MRDTQPPLEYLVTSSQTSLEAFELTRLNRAANLRKELREILEEWLKTEVDARLARWILECRRAQNGESDSLAPTPPEPSRIGQMALSFLPEQAGSQDVSFQIDVPHVPQKVSAGGRAPCARSRSRNDRNPMSAPMKSKDASVCLRLFEQFLARPAESIDGPAETQCHDPGVAGVAEQRSSRDCPEPRQKRVASCRSSPPRTAGVHRRKLHPAPAIQSVFCVAARHRR
jgi:hypothetical protein